MEHRMTQGSRGRSLSGAPSQPAPPAASPAPADPISTGLRRLLSSVSEEPVPDDFLRLLDQLDARMKERP